MSRAEWKTLLSRQQQQFDDYSGELLMVNVSGGAASAEAWKRCLDKYGAARVHPVFADTESEDPDTYRFLDDCQRVFGQRLTVVRAGGDIWDCFHKHGMMRIAAAGNACKASVELKQKPLDAEYERSEADGQAIGLNFDEPERMARLSARLSARRILYPLATSPRLSECDIISRIRGYGIEPPAIYDDGFTHNNCLGKGGCVLAGLSQWAAYYKLFPERFAYAEQREKEFIDRTGFTVLRDQSRNSVKPYPLSRLRIDVDAGREFGNDWVSPCLCFTPSLFSMDELSK